MQADNTKLSLIAKFQQDQLSVIAAQNSRILLVSKSVHCEITLFLELVILSSQFNVTVKNIFPKIWFCNKLIFGEIKVFFWCDN